MNRKLEMFANSWKKVDERKKNKEKKRRNRNTNRELRIIGSLDRKSVRRSKIMSKKKEIKKEWKEEIKRNSKMKIFAENVYVEANIMEKRKMFHKQ